jgi:hypothetical protein
LYRSEFDQDVWQHRELIKLSNENLNFFKENKDRFTFRDYEITRSYIVSINDLRSLLLKFRVKIKAHGFKAISFIQIDGEDFRRALNEEDNDSESTYKRVDTTLVRRVFEELYETYESNNENRNNKFQAFLKAQTKDIIFTKDRKIAMVLTFNIIGRKNLEYKIAYLKNNLQISKRIGTITNNDIARSLNSDDYEKLKNKYAWFHKEQIKRWFEKVQKVKT